VIREVTAPTSGIVTAIDGETLGLTVVALGGGRQVESDVVNPAVGLSDVVSLGDRVSKGQPLARIHAARESQADEAGQAVRAAITLEDNPAPQPALVLEQIT
jgi:thymidine phosphorylase